MIYLNTKEAIMKTADSQMRAIRSYRERQAAKGLVLVQVWVPTELVERVKKYAKRLRRDK
jgi:hypothetical protein